MERVWKYELGGHDRVSLQAVIEQSGDTFGGSDRASLGINLEAVIKRDWTSTWWWSMDGTLGAETQFSS